jgi:hypothetical protein
LSRRQGGRETRRLTEEALAKSGLATDPEEEFRSGEESADRSENGDKAEIEPRRVATLERGKSRWEETQKGDTDGTALGDHRERRRGDGRAG